MNLLGVFQNEEAVLLSFQRIQVFILLLYWLIDIHMEDDPKLAPRLIHQGSINRSYNHILKACVLFQNSLKGLIRVNLCLT